VDRKELNDAAAKGYRYALPLLMVREPGAVDKARFEYKVVRTGSVTGGAEPLSDLGRQGYRLVEATPHELVFERPAGGEHASQVAPVAEVSSPDDRFAIVSAKRSPTINREMKQLLAAGYRPVGGAPAGRSSRTDRLKDVKSWPLWKSRLAHPANTNTRSSPTTAVSRRNRKID
jgi:hypothetical protein